jgi:hypothetical protein
MAIPPLHGQFAHREEFAQSPLDAGEHDLGEGYARQTVATMRISVPEPGGARSYALLRAQLFKKRSF